MKHVQIQNADMAWHIAADVHFPPAFDESKQYPTIISVHPLAAVRNRHPAMSTEKRWLKQAMS